MDRTVAKYYAFELTRSAHLSGPVWVLFLLSRGVSYTGVGLLDVAFSLTVVLSEVPTGYVGDRIGRRRALLVGTAGSAVGSLLFAFGTSLPTFLVAYVTLAVARTFTSGSDSAWLYDTLAARTDEASFARIRGRGRALGLAASGAGALAGGLLGSVDLSWPWIASGLVTALAVPVVLTFPAPSTVADGDDGPSTDDATGAEATDDRGALSVARDLLTGPLRWFVVYTGVFGAALTVVNFFVQPVTRDAVVDLSTVVGVSPDPVVVLGVVYAAFTLVSAVVTSRAGHVRAVVGLERYFVAVPPALGLALALVLVFPVAAVPLFFLQRATISLTEPLRGQYLNDRTPSVGRATTLSAVSMAHAVLALPFELGGGRLADVVGPATAVGVVGAFLAVAALPLGAAHFGRPRVATALGRSPDEGSGGD